jgi:L-lactate dehydrogenase complex protein LldG
MAEHGDRTTFLDRARTRLARGVPHNMVHPPIERPTSVPLIAYRNLDTADLVGTFERALVAASAVCHLVEGDTVPEDVLQTVIDVAPAPTAVMSDEPEAARVGVALERLGVRVSSYGMAEAAAAGIGVTSAVAAVAATGSVVVDSRRAGGRGASLLPPVHLCVLPAARLVATPADVLRPLRGRPDALPSNLVLITGPSRTGDIEQLLTLGVHGPVAVHVVLTGVKD